FDVRASKLDKHERELRELAWGLAERKQDLDRRDAAVSNQVRLLKRRDDVLALIRKSADRIHEAVKEREKRLVEVKHLDEVAKSSDSRLEPIKKAKPSGDWEVRAKEAAIKELVAEREGRALRASAEAFKSEAAVEWELDTLRDLARRLKLSEDVVPKNEFELLDRSTLEDLEVRWAAKENELRKRNIEATGLFEQTLAFARDRLASIREAKSKSQANLNVSFGAALLRSDVDGEVTSWFAKQDENRKAEIGHREQQLLANALARDRTNIPAYVRLLELESFPSAAGLPSALLRGRQFLILAREHGFSPISTAGSEVGELLKKRFTDPLSAVKCDAKLLLQWQENGFGLTFEAWKVRHLTDGQLFELKVYIEAARERLREISMGFPDGFQEHVKVDKAQIEKEFEALQQEIKLRGESKEGVVDLSTVPQDVLRRHLRIVYDDPSDDPHFRQIYWDQMRLFLARSGPNSEAERLKAELA